MMQNKLFRVLLVFLFAFLARNPAVLGVEFGGSEEMPFHVTYDDSPVTVVPGQDFTASIYFRIPDEYYLYQEKTELVLQSTDGLTASPVQKSQSTLKDDPFFGKTVPVYFNEAKLDLLIRIPDKAWDGEKRITGEIRFQGCSTELCYRPMKVPFTVGLVSKVPEAAAYLNSKSAVSHTIPPKPTFFQKIKAHLAGVDFSSLTEASIGWAILISFLGGVLTDFTPCVWPMIPVTLAIIGVRKKTSPLKNLAAVSVLVLGMAVMYATLGVVAALLGKSLGFLFQSLVFLILLEVVLLVMAASLLGFFEIQLPAKLQSRLAAMSASGYRGVFLVGLTMGFLAAPCVGPIVGPLLVFVAQTRSVATGFILLISYALGMGMIFLLLGTFYGALQGKLKTGTWSTRLKKAIGVLMLIVAIYYGQTIYAQVADRPKEVAAFWTHGLDQALEKARKESKPVLIDFFAEWCPPCLELDRGAFSDPEIQDTLAQDWVAVKIDCTAETPECAEAIRRFSVIGWPTVVFMDARQEEASEERLVGKVVSPEELKVILNRVQSAQ